MKKIFKLLLIIFLISINVFNLKADCESDKENANNITYITVPYIDGEKFVDEISMFSNSDDLYVTITNDFNSDEKTIHFENGNVGYSLVYDDVYVNISVKVYSDTCPNEMLREISIKANRLNKYSKLDACTKVIGGSPLCIVDTETPDMTEEEFIKKVNKDMNSISTKLTIRRGIRRYYLYAVIPFAVVALGFLIAIYIHKQKLKKVYKKGAK